jgi:hypothetical protein
MKFPSKYAAIVFVIGGCIVCLIDKIKEMFSRGS